MRQWFVIRLDAEVSTMKILVKYLNTIYDGKSFFVQVGVI